MSKKTKTFLPKKKVLSTDNLSPHNTPKNDRKVHSLNNAVVLYCNPTRKKGVS